MSKPYSSVAAKARRSSRASMRAPTETAVSVSKKGGVIPQKRWSASLSGNAFGMGGALKISSKRKTGISRAVAPSATSTTVSQYKPRVSGGSSANSFTIENRELLSSVIWQGTSGFELTEYAINPGLSTTFQYASNVSKNYTRYAMNVCLLWAPSVPSTALGQIAFAMDRDNTAPAPTSMQEILSYENNVVTSLWKNVSFPSSGMFASSEKLLYLRYGPLDDFTQINLYDLMKVFVVLNGVSLVGLTPGQSLGSLYIQYKITFFNQKLQDVVESNIFSVNPLYNTQTSAPELYPNIDTSEKEVDMKYQYGDGDIQYMVNPVSATSAYMAFPSAGYYTIDIFENFLNTSPVLPSATVPADVPILTSIGYAIDWASGPVSPESQPILITTVTDQTAVGHNKYVIRVNESGTYLGTDGPVGEGWVLMEGQGAYAAIIANPAVGTGTSTMSISNCYAVVNRISASEAAWYDPILFPEGAIASTALSLITHRRKFHPIKGHSRRKVQIQYQNKQKVQEDISFEPQTSQDVQPRQEKVEQQRSQTGWFR